MRPRPRQRRPLATRIFYVIALLVVLSMVLSLFIPVFVPNP
jgi:predicted nucleic acid-binding Zn ribbon protein